MEWRVYYSDLTLVPIGLLSLLLYHIFLYYKVRTQPLQTAIGINNQGRRLWIHHMLKDNDSKNVLAVQSLRNSIMESTLMATTTILLSAGLATYMTYVSHDIKELVQLGPTIPAIPANLKLLIVLGFLCISFLCSTHSIQLVNQVNYMVNIPLPNVNVGVITADYLGTLLEKSYAYSTIGSRSFYFSFPLLLWVFSSIPVFLTSIILLHSLYTLDFPLTNANNYNTHNIDYPASDSASTTPQGKLNSKEFDVSTMS